MLDILLVVVQVLMDSLNKFSWKNSNMVVEEFKLGRKTVFDNKFSTRLKNRQHFMFFLNFKIYTLYLIIILA